MPQVKLLQYSDWEKNILNKHFFILECIYIFNTHVSLVSMN